MEIKEFHLKQLLIFLKLIQVKILTKKQLNESLKELYETNFFKDVQFSIKKIKFNNKC